MERRPVSRWQNLKIQYSILSDFVQIGTRDVQNWYKEKRYTLSTKYEDDVCHAGKIYTTYHSKWFCTNL